MSNKKVISLRCKPGLAYAVIISILLFELQPLIPSFIQIFEVSMAIICLLRKLLIFKGWENEIKYFRQFLVAFVLMVGELMWENVMVWAVSATDDRKYEKVPALQDNVLKVLRYFDFKWLAHDFGNTTIFLCWALMLAFSVLWEQLPFSGLGIMSRYCFTIALSRLLRVISFFCTVLPSPRAGCYEERFPPPPDHWLDWLAVGVREMRGFGGCNDLLFSGHASFWILTPLVFRTYYTSSTSVGKLVGGYLWLVLVITCLQDVNTLQHYSVDMFIACVVTWGIWSQLEWIYPRRKFISETCSEVDPVKLPHWLLSFIVFSVLIASIIVWKGNA